MVTLDINYCFTYYRLNCHQCVLHIWLHLLSMEIVGVDLLVFCLVDVDII